MKRSISSSDQVRIFSKLSQANQAFQAIYPGDNPTRQPVHTVYGDANLFSAETAAKMSEVALETMDTYAPDAKTLAQAFDLPGNTTLHDSVYSKVRQKLKTEALEDFRIDFEDGYGNRPDDEEDATAESAALEVAKGMENNSLPPFIGIRIKPFTEDLKERGARTLDIFLSTLLGATGNKLPDNFVVMLPKVSIPAQVAALIGLLEIIEAETGLEPGTLKMETMLETTQSIMNDEGRNPLMAIVRAGKGRLIAAAFGTYDYTAACNITAKYQVMAHPVCDFAHHMTRVALGGTGIFLTDGATNVMPVGPHRGDDLNSEQMKENTDVVHSAWKLSYDHIRHSLYMGFYQGWDLNPAQLPARYTAVFTFFLESYHAAAERLRLFVDKAGRVTLTEGIFDDAATGQGLLNYFLAALNCGAISKEETETTGLTLEEIRTRSLLKILQGRKG